MEHHNTGYASFPSIALIAAAVACDERIQVFDFIGNSTNGVLWKADLRIQGAGVLLNGHGLSSEVVYQVMGEIEP